VLSALNDTAKVIGLRAGMPAREAADLMLQSAG
jgi:hypothetical protein